MADPRDDDLALEEMSDDQLAMEASDLRSAIEAINLDLLDDSKGGYWRSDDWRIRARGARAYKQADLNAANALIKARRERQEALARAQRRQEAEALQAAAAERRKAVGVRANSTKGNYIGPEQAEAMRISLEKDRLRTERTLICQEREKGKDRAIIRLFKQEYGLEAYLRLVAMLPAEMRSDQPLVVPDAPGWPRVGPNG